MNANKLLGAIAAAVKERRHYLGLTQKQLASMAGVSERLIRLVEAGQAPGVGIENLVMILAPLGLELALEGGEGRLSASPEPSDENDQYELLLRNAVNSWGGVESNGE